MGQIVDDHTVRKLEIDKLGNHYSGYMQSSKAYIALSPLWLQGGQILLGTGKVNAAVVAVFYANI